MSWSYKTINWLPNLPQEIILRCNNTTVDNDLNSEVVNWLTENIVERGAIRFTISDISTSVNNAITDLDSDYKLLYLLNNTDNLNEIVFYKEPNCDIARSGGLSKNISDLIEIDRAIIANNIWMVVNTRILHCIKSSLNNTLALCIALNYPYFLVS